MKRTILLLLALCLLLTGCGTLGGVTPSSETVTAATDAAATSATEPVSTKSILDTREAFDNAGTLWYIPNSQVEAQQYPMLYAFDGQLLMTVLSNSYGGNGTLTLMLLSAETGELLQSRSVPSGGSAAAQLCGNRIAVCDSTDGTVAILDAQLNETARYSLTPDQGQWFLGTDLDTLYRFHYSDGISAVSLSSGEERTIHNITNLIVCDTTEAGICFTGVDRATQKYGAFCLDLASGALTEPPFSGDFSRISRSSEVWFANNYNDETTCIFGTAAEANVASAQDGTFSLLNPLGHILFTGLDGRLSLYTSYGAFLSSCNLPGWYVRNAVWCEKLSGYLLLATDENGASRLLFWDIHTATDGENLQMQSLTDYRTIPGGTSADASLYQRAQDIADRFGVEVRIADQCETDFPYFSGYQVSDYESVSAGLDTLETALSVFPEGFFRQLIYGHISSVRFQLIGGLSATNGFGGNGNYGAFTDTRNDVCNIVIDLYSIRTILVWHELSHAIDQRLAWDAVLRSDALYSEETWSAYNPEDFTYTGEYGAAIRIQAEWYSYFVDNYSMTNATEDRAVTFSYAIDNGGTLFQNPGLKAKLQYYSDCIRDCFDTTQWPETVPWEAPLR